jgi:hypothetical protein
MREEVCPTCNGERTITVDHFTPSRGHWTTEEPCETCTSDEYVEIEGEELDALEKSFWASLRAPDVDGTDR